ncbi:MAG: mannose-1-phosphate guanylyltransferase [bacterium]|nr:mannose-1-phosphate guanylyltransferase [bacterium]
MKEQGGCLLREDTMIYAVILAGGRGERFWPKSRERRPKQFLSLASEKTMLEETVDRILPVVLAENVVIVATSELGNMVRSLLSGIKESNLLLEPFGRNTAPAIAYAASCLHRRDPDAIMICLPADHYIKERKKFTASIERAVSVAKDNWLVTFGITPTRPDTGYGYIEVGEEIENGVFRVKSFKEKPTKKRAMEFFKAKSFLWNSGMFVWKVKTIIDEIKKHAPYIAEKLFNNQNQQLGREELTKAYDGLPAISVDYAVMERSQRTAVLKGDFIWDDVGSWLSLERLLGKDKNGNTIVGEAFLKDSSNCIVSNEKGITALLGTSDLVVVNTDDVLFVCKKSHVDRIKKFIEEMGEDEKLKKYL